jgi:hypothetical protein
MAQPGKPDDAFAEYGLSIFGRRAASEEFPTYDDRGVAIVFVAQLEEALEKALETHFTIPVEAARQMFSYPDGPLAELNAKIAMGYALGIYDERMRDDLRWIKDIRNAFAHVRFEINFSTPEIQAAVAQLHFSNEIIKGSTEVPPGGSVSIVSGEPTILGTRQHFTSCLFTLTVLLRYQQDENKPLRLLRTSFYPYPARAT